MEWKFISIFNTGLNPALNISLCFLSFMIGIYLAEKNLKINSNFLGLITWILTLILVNSSTLLNLLKK